MNLRKAAVTLAMGGAALTLIGVGVGASFTDSATATENISVGTFALQLSSTQAGVNVVNDHTITYTVPTLTSSAAGSAPLAFSVKDNGTIPMSSVTITAVVTGDGNFTSIAPPAAFPLAAGASQLVNVGLQWGSLSNSDLGQSATVTYTIAAVG